MRAQIASEAALLVAAEWGAGIETVVGVDPHRPGFDLSSHAMGELDILRPNRGHQSVDCAVGDGYRLIRVIETDRGEHWTEDLLLRDLHVWFYFGEDGGLHEKALAVIA